MNIKSFIYTKQMKLELDFIPTLAFLFFNTKKITLLENLYQKLLRLNPHIEVIGINGSNGNINGSIPFITKSNQISVILFDLDKKYFFVDILNTCKNFNSNFFKNTTKYKNSAVLIFPPFKYDINYFLDKIEGNIMKDIYGGVYKNGEYGAFYNGKFFKDKIITIYFNQDIIQFYSLAIHGFKPIGLKFKVTKAKDNKIYELNGEPALEIIENYMGNIKQENINKFLHPFCVYHNKYESLASIQKIDRKENSISFFKYIYENEYIRITIPSNQFSIMNFLEEQLKNIECDALFMFSCVGRFAYYGELVEFEISKVRDILQKPFAGFLTYGEIGSNNINSKSILQNQTMNLVFVKAKR